jgi:hypothetical protein
MMTCHQVRWPSSESDSRPTAQRVRDMADNALAMVINETEPKTQAPSALEWPNRSYRGRLSASRTRFE